MTRREISAIQDPTAREIVYKHIIEGKTFRQIAGEMYYSRSSVRRKFRAAMRGLAAGNPDSPTKNKS